MNEFVKLGNYWIRPDMISVLLPSYNNDNCTYLTVFGISETFTINMSVDEVLKLLGQE